MHKKAAYCLLIGGFAWISVICVEFFHAPHRNLWVWQSARLPEGNTISREAAVAELRGLQRGLDHYYDQLFVAGFLMLVGGVVNGIHLRPKDTTPNRPANGSRPMPIKTNSTSSTAGPPR